jgi:hypothetical protein
MFRNEPDRKRKGNAMFSTLSIRDLEALTTQELQRLHADLLDILRHGNLAPHERQEIQRVAGSIRLVLNRRTMRPHLGL